MIKVKNLLEALNNPDVVSGKLYFRPFGYPEDAIICVDGEYINIISISDDRQPIDFSVAMVANLQWLTGEYEILTPDEVFKSNET